MPGAVVSQYEHGARRAIDGGEVWDKNVENEQMQPNNGPLFTDNGTNAKKLPSFFLRANRHNQLISGPVGAAFFHDETSLRCAAFCGVHGRAAQGYFSSLKTST